MIRFKLPGNTKSKLIILILLIFIAFFIFSFEHKKNSTEFILPNQNNIETISPK